mmetsp:Transcript_34726/g.73972  ORF Transcript_34726/g.73972 Transcript_34726/m.73972 type:complete len:81 (+) Transcript_34726:220-462(+)
MQCAIGQKQRYKPQYRDHSSAQPIHSRIRHMKTLFSTTSGTKSALYTKVFDETPPPTYSMVFPRTYTAEAKTKNSHPSIP